MCPVAEASTGQENAVHKLGFCLLAFFIFSIFSAVIDFLPFLHPLRPSLTTGILGLLVVGITGRFLVLIRHKITVSLIALTFWFILCIPMAMHRGGAFALVMDEWQKFVFTFFLAAGLIWNYFQCRKIIHLIGYSVILMALIALKLNVMEMGRLSLPNTRYSNPNDLAMILLTAIPCLGMMAVRKGNGIRRIIAVLGAVPVLLAIAKTGSRAALVGMAVMLIVVFFQASMGQKVKLIALMGICSVLLVFIVPQSLRSRFKTIFGSGAQSAEEESEATASAASRKMLLMDSLTLTARHPVFGVGPGLFPVAQDKLARERGEEIGNWHVTHNTYTQVSSESGIPGLVLFLTIIVYALRTLQRVIKTQTRIPGWNDIHLMARTLRLSLISFLTVACFASMAYLPFLAVLCGLTVAIEYSAQSLLAAVPKAPAAVPRPVVARAAASIGARPSPSRA